MTKAVAYFRISSQANVNGDSLERQRAAVTAYARAQGIEIVAEFEDLAVSGADPIDTRPGFADLLNRIEGNGVRMILVEDASRFARDLTVQLTGHAHLQAMGIELVPVNAPDAFTDETPTAVMIRQILGAVAQFEKAQLVAKLRAARDRKRAETGRCGGTEPAAPEVVRMAKRLSRRGLSLRKISAEMAAAGHLGPRGKPFSAEGVRLLINRKIPRRAAS